MKVEKMKGIVVEKNSENCVLLVSDGTFMTVKATDELQIGTVIYMNDTVRSTAFYLKKAASMIAAVFVVAFLGVGAYSWTIPVQYINIDINPSVELVINRYDRIIKMAPLNDDGEKLLESVDLQLKKYEKGVNAVIETAKDLGYLQNEGDVLISISSSDNERRQKTQAEIEEKVTQEAEVLLFDSLEHDQSAREGLSPGKSKIISKVMQSGTNLTEEELAAAPVKDLMLRIRENKKMNMELEKEAKQQEKLQKQMEKAGLKENNESNGDKNGNQGQDKDSNKPDNNGKKDDRSNENDKTNNGKQQDKDSKEKEDKSQENKGSKEKEDKSQGSNGSNQQNNNDSNSMNKAQGEGNDDSLGRKGNPESGNPGKNADKAEPQGQGLKNQSSGQQSQNKEKADEKDNGNQSADKNNSKDDVIKEKHDVGGEDLSEKDSEGTEKNNKSDDAGDNKNNGSEKNENNNKDSGKDGQNSGKDSGGSGNSGGKG